MWALADDRDNVLHIDSRNDPPALKGLTQTWIRPRQHDIQDLMNDGLFRYRAPQDLGEGAEPDGVVYTVDRIGGWVSAAYASRGTTRKEAFDRVRARLKRRRDQAMFGGIAWRGFPVQTDNVSQQRVTGLMLYVLANNLIPGMFPVDGVGWRMADNQVVLLDIASALDLAQTVGTHVNSCYRVQAAHEQALDRLLTADEVFAYDITTNWPSNT